MNSTDILKILGKPYFQAPNCVIFDTPGPSGVGIL
jgi:hypothetical protein